MRILVTFITLLLVQAVFAGGGSVGTMKVKDLVALIQKQKSKTIVHQLNKNEKSILFSIGTSDNGNWNIQKINVEKALPQELIDALEKSAEVNDWVEIK